MDKVVHESLLRLARKIGPEILSVPISIDYNPEYTAYTTARGIWLSNEVVTTEPHNAEIYVAHEIFHHVVGDCESTSRFHPYVVNMAEDYRINQLLEELLGYDITKVGAVGLRDKKYDRLSIKEIAQSLVKQGVTSYSHYAQELPNKQILAAAHAVKLRYGLFKRRWYFHMDQVDTNKYIDSIESAIHKACVVRYLRNVNLHYAVAGLWAHLYLPQATHTMKSPEKLRALRPSQAITYCIDSDRFRNKTQGNASRSALVASKILECLDQDGWWLTDRIERTTNNISKMTDELAARSKRKRRTSFPNLSTRKLRKRLLSAQKRLIRYQNMKPIYVMLEEQSVKIKPGKRTKMPSLHTAEHERDKGQVLLPNIVNSELTRRIFRASRRILSSVDQHTEALEKIKSQLGGLLSDTSHSQIETPKPNASTEDGESKDDMNIGNLGNATGDAGDSGSKDDESQKGGGKGSVAGSTFESQLALEQAVFDHSASLLHIINLMHEIESLLSSQRRRRTDDNTSMPLGLSYGSDLENVEASEFALLANEATRMDFYVRLSQGALMQRQPIERRQSAVIVCIDTSGSMHGGRLEQALAFTLAFAKKLIQYGRGFSVVLFDTDAYASLTFNRQPSILDLLAIFKHLRSGGTEFQPPIECALDIKDAQRWKETVIILVTDGESHFTDPDAIKRRLGRKDTMQAVLIGNKHIKDAATEAMFDDIYTTSKKDSLTTLIKLARDHL